MMRIHAVVARPKTGYRLALALILGVAAAGIVVPGSGSVAAQTENPCALLMTDEIQMLTPNEHISDGARAAQSPDSTTCRYTWGAGLGRFTLAVSINTASRMFAGMNADAIKQVLVSSTMPGTTDAAIPDVGQAAVFKAYSPLYAGASTYLKDRILEVNLDGFDAREKKGQLISLLKSAASRL